MEKNDPLYRSLLSVAAEQNIRFIYASIARRNGDGANAFRPDRSQQARPLNPYVIQNTFLTCMPCAAGSTCKSSASRFFNVFGPNEYTKARWPLGVQGFQQSGKPAWRHFQILP
jgi:nucleoside-diphosphate-sugar epimerase